MIDARHALRLTSVFACGLFAGAAALADAANPVPPRELRGRQGAECRASETGPAFKLTVKGLKDRKGRLQLELYPANDEDFLAADKKLIAAGKVFRRVDKALPASGDPVICIRAPAPGRYALVVLHDRDENGKFGFSRDGVAFPGDPRILRGKPEAGKASLTASAGVVKEEVTMQYLRGIRFAPLS